MCQSQLGNVAPLVERYRQARLRPFGSKGGQCGLGAVVASGFLHVEHAPPASSVSDDAEQPCLGGVNVLGQHDAVLRGDGAGIVWPPQMTGS